MVNTLKTGLSLVNTTNTLNSGNWFLIGQYSQVDLAKVDIDDLADLAMEHGVNAVPTVIAVKNGEIVDKLVGVADEDVLATFINKLRD